MLARREQSTGQHGRDELVLLGQTQTPKFKVILVSELMCVSQNNWKRMVLSVLHSLLQEWQQTAKLAPISLS